MEYFCTCCGLRVREFVSADYLDAEHLNHERYKQTRQAILYPVCMSLPRHGTFGVWFDAYKGCVEEFCIAPEYRMALWIKRNEVKYTTADLYNDADFET